MLIEIPVLDHGFVRLDGLMIDLQTLYDYVGGDTTLDELLDVDLSVVNGARVSVGLRKRVLDATDEVLLDYLMSHHHGTPFEQNGFRFHVKAPIFIFREWQRHRIGSFNELSGRYKEFKNPDFYVPKAQDFRTQIGKPGAYSFEKWPGNTKNAMATMQRHFEDSYDLYKWYIDQGMAKEQARNVLPLALYSEMYWTVNARSLMNFCNLRNASQALWEIQQYAQVVEAEWATHMPRSHETFVNNGRVAP